MKGKLILIEGTDCSGKLTQSKLLVKKLIDNGRKVKVISFPNYDSPTGKIVGGPYLGKPSISECWFPEGAPNVDPKVSSLLYATDRLYNLPKITEYLNQGIDIVLDRYTVSNMAHQGGKLPNQHDRYSMYKWLDDLEYRYLELPRPDISFLLYMPHEYAQQLRIARSSTEELDGNERSKEHLMDAERAYLEVADLYDFEIIDCIKDNKIRTREDINNELYDKVIEKIKQSV